MLALPRSLTTVGHALGAAAELVEAAKAAADSMAGDRDSAEKEALSTALGGGATGKGYTGSAPKGGAGALKELEKRQKSRGTRTQRDMLDRALLDLAAFYRDVLALQLHTGAAPVHADLAEQAGTVAPGLEPRGHPAPHRRGPRLPHIAGGQRRPAARRRGDGAGPQGRLTLPLDFSSSTVTTPP